jgi:hypothetical protein
MEVKVLDQTGRLVAMGKVEESSPTDSVAVVTADQEIRAGYLVMRS